jgi:hypothetical protein
MISKPLLTLAIFGLSVLTYAQSVIDINLSGRVLDASGVGVSGVVITIKDSPYLDSTDASGHWSIFNQVPVSLGAPSLASQKKANQGTLFNMMGRKMEGANLAPGAYMMRNPAGSHHTQTVALSKIAGEIDSLVVKYHGSVVGRLEQANLVFGALDDMILRVVSPLLTPRTAKSEEPLFYAGRADRTSEL